MQLFRLVESLHPSKCPIVMDAISGPMIYSIWKKEDAKLYPVRAVAMHMSMRGSHLRNVPNELQGVIPNKVIVMVNPIIEPEPHTGSSI